MSDLWTFQKLKNSVLQGACIKSCSWIQLMLPCQHELLEGEKKQQCFSISKHSLLHLFSLCSMVSFQSMQCYTVGMLLSLFTLNREYKTGKVNCGKGDRWNFSSFIKNKKLWICMQSLFYMWYTVNRSLCLYHSLLKCYNLKDIFT